MSTPSNARVFISYARSDGAEYATRLRKRLQSEHPKITLWQDVISERAGHDWWLQITEALDHVETMVLVLRDEKREEPVAIIAALQGAGGYGKTTMASAL
ncbi:MAG: toll/interleukin-1 receptor domain-containing protein [Terriglobia bacterium]